MPKYPGLECFFCENKNIRLPQIGISLSMYGDHYSFCRKCLTSLSADAFWDKFFKLMEDPYPPHLTARAIEELKHELENP